MQESSRPTSARPQSEKSNNDVYPSGSLWNNPPASVFPQGNNEVFPAWNIHSNNELYPAFRDLRFSITETAKTRFSRVRLTRGTARALLGFSRRVRPGKNEVYPVCQAALKGRNVCKNESSLLGRIRSESPDFGFWDLLRRHSYKRDIPGNPVCITVPKLLNDEVYLRSRRG